jgi:hypothetical protein
VLVRWFERTDHLVVLGHEGDCPLFSGPPAATASSGAGGARPEAVDTRSERKRGQSASLLVTGTTYAARDVFDGDPMGVLIGDHCDCVPQIARRFLATPPQQRPLLMHVYLPDDRQVDFGSCGLPRPVPALPWLIRQGFYLHRPGEPYPTTGVFLVLLAISLGKSVDVAGLDNDQHPGGATYAGAANKGVELPAHHSRECDLTHLSAGLARATRPVSLPETLARLLDAGEAYSQDALMFASAPAVVVFSLRSKYTCKPPVEGRLGTSVGDRELWPLLPIARRSTASGLP